jgi:hypothetical protein
MALLKDRVGAASSTVGAGTVALGAGLPPGTRVNPGNWKTFAEAGVAHGDTVRYLILDSNGAWEYGLGVYTETTGTVFDLATAVSVTISADGLTVTGTGTTSANQGARVADSGGKATGKYYFEQTIMALTTSPNRGAGIGTTGSTYTGMGTNATVGVNMYPNSGGIWANGSAILGIAGRSVGDIIGYAVDLDNRRIWIRPNPGAIWNNNVANNPATNVGGIVVPAGTMVPFVTFGGTSGVAGSSFKANFGASAFGGVVPAGFTAGWPP